MEVQCIVWTHVTCPIPLLYQILHLAAAVLYTVGIPVTFHMPLFHQILHLAAAVLYIAETIASSSTLISQITMPHPMAVQYMPMTLALSLTTFFQTIPHPMEAEHIAMTTVHLPKLFSGTTLQLQTAVQYIPMITAHSIILRHTTTQLQIMVGLFSVEASQNFIMLISSIILPLEDLHFI